MNYKVGQILYMTNSESLKIIPIQVVEEVSRTTMSGTEITYMIQLPDKKKTTADIKAIKGEVYSDINILKTDMLKRATSSIENMINIAINLSKEAFKKEDKNIVNQKENDVQVETNDDIILVDLGNGVKAKMKTNELEKVANQ